MLPADLVPSTFQGLPTHALIVHATVIGLPLTTIALLLCAFSAHIRRRVGIVLPLAGIVSLVLVPLSTMSGEDLKARVYNSVSGPLILRHQRAADHLLPWAIGLAAMCIVVYVVGLVGPRKQARSVGAATAAPSKATPGRRAPLRGSSPISVVVAVLAAVAAIGTGIQVTYVGHLGAEAVWNGYSQLPVQKNLPNP